MRRPLRLTRAILGATAAAVVLAACGPGEPEGLSDAIDRIVRSAMEDGPIAGVAVEVARGSRIVHRAGYGWADVEDQLPVTPETIFEVGSITKQFTAATILSLADEGKLSLDDRLTKYVPDYPGYGSDVTVATLLSHTSGIKNYTTMDRWWETLAVEMSPRDLIGVFEPVPFDFRPGTRFSYSNSGYAVLGWIAEQVTGQPFGGILNERLFVPLGLSSTAFCDDRALIPNRARGYEVVDGELRHSAHLSMSQAYAAGGVCSNVDDLMRWTWQLARGQAIGRDAYETMSTPATLTDGSRIEYGYGMSVGYLEGHHRVSHVGGMLGFTSQLTHYDDDDVTIVVLTNTQSASAAAIETGIARLMLGLGDQQVHDLLLSPEELAQYTGTYDLTLASVTVRGEDGRLQTDVDVPGVRGHQTLLYQGDDHFIAESDTEISVSFQVRDGQADSVMLTHDGITVRGARVGL